MSSLTKWYSLSALGCSMVFGLSSCGIFGSNPDSDKPIESISDDSSEEKEEIVEEKVGPPTAAPVPGRKGYVYNPYTGGVVDVRGLSAGLLVRDPADPDTSHTFRVPVFE